MMQKTRALSEVGHTKEHATLAINNNINMHCEPDIHVQLLNFAGVPHIYVKCPPNCNVSFFFTYTSLSD